MNLVEEVSKLVFSRDLRDSHHTISHQFLDLVILDVDVFGLGVHDVVLGELHTAIVVFMKDSRPGGSSMQISQDAIEVGSFTASSTQSNVLCLC